MFSGIGRAGINAHDGEGLPAQMESDFVFVDSLSNRTVGANSMEAAWMGYFSMCPDYWVRADRRRADGHTVLIAGEAGGTNRWGAMANTRRMDGRFSCRSTGRMVSFCVQQTVYELLARRWP